jgi:pyruvate,water dikinase
MTWIAPLETLVSRDSHAIGGKGAALGRLWANRLRIPRTLCITTRAYGDFVASAGLKEKIQLELSRKIFSQMRWEEIWDTSQRIRLLFLRSPMPPGMASAISESISQTFGDSATVVRSSAPEEDQSGHSFAGLHASYTHLHGPAAVIHHLKLVWASLWSDAALLYRQELGLDTATSTMAVLVQEMVSGQVSGIYFTQDPNQADRGIIEAVHGMNPPLVDGKISPDRWILEVNSGSIINHTAPESRSQWQPPADKAADDRLVPLPETLRHKPPLRPVQITTLWEAGTQISALTGAPHDIEWTFRGDDLVLLQARPITALSQAADGDQRAWYLSLHRSLDNLLDLRRRIEEVLIPKMRATADQLAAIRHGDFSDADLAAEIRRRWEINQHWVSVYWEDFIPFAHGMRLFGQIYNEVMTPDDPYAFMALLKNQDLISLRRNRSLADLAAGVRRRPERGLALKQGKLDDLDNAFRQQLEAFILRYGDLSCPVTGAVDCAPDAGTLANVVLEMAKLPEASSSAKGHASPEDLEADFLDACTSTSVDDCRQLLSLARSSYRLRDDDNIILGAIEARLIAAVQEGRRRLVSGSPVIAEVLAELGLNAEAEMTPQRDGLPPPAVRDRQITGQPAGPGLARGKARVIHQHTDIARFKRGEIIVCDGVDPNMTFVMPLAAAIVERRGGMLIHGAIIAREYGLPCVTGVADATTRIGTGQTITVDGYLGIVTLGDDLGKDESAKIADHAVVRDEGPIVPA